MGSVIITLKYMMNQLRPDTCRDTKLHNKKGLHLLDYEQGSCREMEGRKKKKKETWSDLVYSQQGGSFVTYLCGWTMMGVGLL